VSSVWSSDFSLGPSARVWLTCARMQPVCRAVIDVGTNSTKLLVAEVAGHRVQPLFERSKQTRLGRGFYETHQLQPQAIAETAAAAARFADTARQWGAASIRVIATSAARDAMNPGELISAIEQASGLSVEIISGEQEAEWAFRGVTSDAELARHPVLLLEIGGGSTQLILGHGEQTDFRHSFPLGAVRLMEKIPHSDPPRASELEACRQWLKDFVQAEVRPKLEPEMRWEAKTHADDGAVLLAGAGGTMSILARMESQLEEYDRVRIEATRVTSERVRWHAERLWSLPLDERRNIIGLPKNRADVILTGVLICEAVMEQLGFAELRISTRGLRFAALMDPV
jgi:exopolyphosphatase / guanosine-5'-triphosphate,3'-diphosphate pyrophosphatase